MNEIIVLCPAKINLFLNIIGKDNHMHYLRAINQSVNLYDILKIKVNNTGKINIICNNPLIPLDYNNTIYQAVLIMKKNYNIKYGFDIKLTKNIPISSGLGGESTDAAGTILGIKDIFKLDISIDKLIKLGMLIGADVPFCIIGGTCMVEGFGEKIQKINLPLQPMIIIKPNFKVSTKEAFEEYDKRCAEYMELNEYVIGYNDFEKTSSKEIQVIKNTLLENGAVLSFMSGSGPSVVGIFNDSNKQKKAYLTLKKHFLAYKVYNVFSSEGVRILRKGK